MSPVAQVAGKVIPWDAPTVVASEPEVLVTSPVRAGKNEAERIPVTWFVFARSILVAAPRKSATLKHAATIHPSFLVLVCGK